MTQSVECGCVRQDTSRELSQYLVRVAEEEKECSIKSGGSGLLKMAFPVYVAKDCMENLTTSSGMGHRLTWDYYTMMYVAHLGFYDYEIWQIDVKTAFLNGYLSKKVYMEQLEGFVNPKYPNRVCKLKRSIYGLKQASRQWNKRFKDEIKKFGFTQNRDKPCVYLKASGGNITFLILYVDDILIIGEAAYILGIKIYRDRSRWLIGLCQSAYIDKILKQYHMENSKRESIPMQEKLRLSKSQGASTTAELKHMQNVPYASVVGPIMYVVRCTRLDVVFAQNITSRFQQNPCDLHLTIVKNILKYLMNTKDMFLVYGDDLKQELRVSCYTDAGYLTDADDLKSQTGYVFVLNGGAVDWKSAKQSIFATSSAEAEYIVAYDASKEAVWVRKFISGLGIVPTIKEPISMYCDNTGAITIANESGITKGARHFHAKVHYLREVIEFGDIKLEKVHTYDNLADPFTKALAFPKHSNYRNIGMITSLLIESWEYFECWLYSLNMWMVPAKLICYSQGMRIGHLNLRKLLYGSDVIIVPEKQKKAMLEALKKMKAVISFKVNPDAKGMVPMISYSAVHQFHIFIFILAVFYVLYSVVTIDLGLAKVGRLPLKFLFVRATTGCLQKVVYKRLATLDTIFQSNTNWTQAVDSCQDRMFVKANKERTNLLKAVIIGAKRTPYHHALFFFDILRWCEYHSNGLLQINPNIRMKCFVDQVVHWMKFQDSTGFCSGSDLIVNEERTRPSGGLRD
ncbi:retrotransposon protein, putative, ty1-copia subclass [Tanacetum coccineum]|uniref:Retrotransposon protein, putative, ty1-copia subclass n=1 Tax=Tanacetum coccineum TaxID=301880 RepID=A0ABQ5GY10_9ASTR